MAIAHQLARANWPFDEIILIRSVRRWKVMDGSKVDSSDLLQAFLQVASDTALARCLLPWVLRNTRTIGMIWV
jgi:hypothetical protein